MTLLTTELLWDGNAIKRALRLLGARTAHINDAQATAQAMRLVWDILQRRGLPAEIFQLPGIMPLISVGHGPILLITYLDDAHPDLVHADGAAPNVAGDVASGAGLLRKAGVLGVLGALASGALRTDDVTLIVEGDRNRGSQALEAWLDASKRDFHAAIWEAHDLPIPTPALFRAATGVILLQVTVHSAPGRIEGHFAGAIPDAAHQLAQLLAELKSRDAEVLVPGFYDGVEGPDAEGIALLQAIAPAMRAWTARGMGDVDTVLTAEHLTLGVFCAPSVTVRSIHVPDCWPFMAHVAQATIEARLMPGQSARGVNRMLTDFVQARVPGAEVQTLLLRPPAPAASLDLGALGETAFVYPVAPGYSPAGLLDTLGIPTLGFATVSRDTSGAQESVSIAGIERASQTVTDVCLQAARDKRAIR
jgi:acetylornithine deacetylase/succinyl-diaminopimelate desuccinylase-like protein